MKRAFCLLLALTLAVGCLTGCGGSETSESSASASTATSTPEPTLPPYQPNVLTGEEEVDGATGERITAIMVNNITSCRPQRGLSDADILFEIKVEGGITRFMALYSDYNAMATEVGPIRSARDQFFRLVLPWQPLYIHDGQSVVQAQYIADYEYEELNSNNAANGYRDPDRLNWSGNRVDKEHTEYTDPEHISEYIEENNVDMSRTYSSTFFNFADYRVKDSAPIEGGEDAEIVTITHSDSYKTRFVYDAADDAYDMQQYYSTDGAWRDTVDEANDTQLSFTNLVVLFTDIHTYKGHEEKDLQYVEYSWGGVGYYFYGGQALKIYWQKGTPLEALRLYYLDENGKCSDTMLEVNTGKSYVAVVDLDEYYDFSYELAEEVDLNAKDAATVEQNVEEADASDDYVATKNEDSPITGEG